MPRSFGVILLSVLTLGGCAEVHNSTPQLVQDLKHPDHNTRVSSALVLHSRGPETVPALIESLNDPNVGVGYATIISLLYIDTWAAQEGLEGALPYLKNDLQSENVKRRETAVEFLTLIGTPEALKIVQDSELPQIKEVTQRLRK